MKNQSILHSKNHYNYSGVMVTLVVAMVLLRMIEIRGAFGFLYTVRKGIHIHHGLITASLQKNHGVMNYTSSNHKGVTHGMKMSTSSSSSSSSSSTSPLDVENILAKTLLSVEECVQVFDTNGARTETSNDSKGRSESQTEPVVFVDASWWHKGEFSGPGRGREIFEDGPRIPGSVYVDMDDIAWQFQSPDRALPHMLPAPELFAAAMDAFGITNEHHIIIYARDTVFFTPRTWFLFRAMGHDPSKLHLMQGSLEQFIEEASSMGVELGLENQGKVAVPRAKDMDLALDSKYQVGVGSKIDIKNVCDMDKVLDVVNNASKPSSADDGDVDFNTNVPSATKTIIVDSRGSSYAKGHIPGSIHIPYTSFVSKENALVMKSVEEMKKVFANAGIDLDASAIEGKEIDIICSCGSGVSACHTFLALELCGRNVDADLAGGRTLVYDGSWAEWGSDPNTPKEI